MKCLFAVDHIFAQDASGTIFTVGGKFPYSAWESYLEVFDQITVVSRSKRLEVTEGLSKSEGDHVSFNLLPSSRGYERLKDLRKARCAISKEVEKADLVVARLPSEFGLIACQLARSLGKPYLIELVACPWDAIWNSGSLLKRFYAPILTWRTKRELWRAPAARYVTKRFLQSRYPTSGKEFVASNVMLNAAQVGFSARKSLKNDNCVVFGTIGSLSTDLKGIDTALRALSCVRFNFEYHVLGEGDASRFRDLAARLGIGDRVFFDGVRPAGSAVMNWLHDLDIYLQPSRQEGLPRSLIEAMSNGLIAVGSTAGGIPELLGPDRLHKPRDKDSLLAIIKSIIDLDSSALDTERNNNVVVAASYDRSKVYQERVLSLRYLRSLVKERF